MFFLVLVFAIISLSFAAPLVNDRRYVDGVSYVDAFAVGQDLVDQAKSRPCLQWSLNYNDYPKSECYYWSTLENRDYDTKFWRFKKGWTGSDDQQAAMASLEKGAVAALDVYSKFAYVSNIKIRIVLTTDDLGPSVTAATSAGAYQDGSSDWQWCSVRIKWQVPGGNRDADLRQVVAHELYHCIQNTKWNTHSPSSSRGPSQWWLEGGAEFFADQVIPPGQSQTLPYGLIGEFRPAKPMYRQDYGAAILFQYLSNQGWSLQRIDQYQELQHYTTDEPTMIKDLYLSEFFPIYPDFAKALFDSEIYYDAPGPFKGQKIRPDYGSFFPQNVWTVPSGQTAMLTGSTEPFSINRYTLIVGPKESISLRFRPPPDCQDRCILNYRLQGTKAWTTLTDTTLANCEEREIRYDFLFTYTGKNLQSDGTGPRIQVQATKKGILKREETCRPEPPPVIETDRCLIGKWQLDMEKTKAFFKERIESKLGSAGVAVTLSGLSISGSGVFDLDENLTNHWVYDHFQVKFTMTSPSLPTSQNEININGMMTAKLVFVEQNKVFMWKEQQTAVSATSSATSEVLSSPLTFDFPVFGSTSMVLEVHYECAGDDLKLSGYLGTDNIYAFTFVKVH